jgi:AcrR family transcriptional regulator
MAGTTIAKRRSPGGPPRNEDTRLRILDSTLQLLEQTPLQAVTIEAIAQKARVSKTTIYRWWSSKASLVIDAFMEQHLGRTPMRRDLPPTEALAAHIRLVIRQYSGFAGRIVAQIIAAGQSDPEVLLEYRERFYRGRRAVIRETMDKWERQELIAPTVDIEVLMDLIYANIYNQLLIEHGPLDEKFADQQVDLMTALLKAVTHAHRTA